MGILPESGGSIGPRDRVAAIGDNGEAMLILALLVNPDGLHPLDLPDRPGNRPFAVGALDAGQFRAVGDFRSEDPGRKQKTDENDAGDKVPHNFFGEINASFMHKTVAFFLHYGRRFPKRKLFANNPHRK